MAGGVCIGVVVRGDLVALAHTLRTVRDHTDPSARVLLVPDAGDADTAAELDMDETFAAYGKVAAHGVAGPAACFNRLAAASTEPVVVLLDAGVLVAPRWLELLTTALRRPGCGLAGPSTNVAANEQAVAPRARPDDESLRSDAAQALRRYGHAVRTLEPRYTLGGFCYAVRREVIDTVGAAEEAYGTGPGWELDYNVRAARAGFRGVWVGAAYVYRSDPVDRSIDTGGPRGEANRRLYQDRFCGLRLRGETTMYRTRCDGDACDHFAPDGLLPTRGGPVALPIPGDRVRSGLDEATPALAAAQLTRVTTPHTRRSPGEQTPYAQKPVSPRPAAPKDPTVAATRHPVGPAPLVSCIMPTRDRDDFVDQAVRYFQRQDYPNAELVIVEDGARGLAERLPRDPRIRIVTSDVTRSIGALRNLACQHARGEIIVQWDDDDWHGPHRLSHQVTPIREGDADITALRDALVFDLPRWEFWQFTKQLHRQLFVRDVHGGTLAFRRSLWDRVARYPDRSLAEDAAFLDQSVRRGARLKALPAKDVFVYLRHATNSWQLGTGADGWERRAEPACLSTDRTYYALRSPAATPDLAPKPVVSCLMPTMDRREFVAQSIEYFRRQDYPAKQLVIVDDGVDNVADLVPDDLDVIYRRLETRTVLGTKRNIACDLARGSVLVHWDDDDWQSPSRLSVQVERLQSTGADICGNRTIPYYDPDARRAWQYRWPSPKRIWAAGPTLCYRKDLWSRSPFPDVATGEDSRFVWNKAVTSMCDVSNAQTVVAIIHPNNTVPKSVGGANWSTIPVTGVEQLLGADLAFYAGAGSTTRSGR